MHTIECFCCGKLKNAKTQLLGRLDSLFFFLADGDLCCEKKKEKNLKLSQRVKELYEVGSFF